MKRLVLITAALVLVASGCSQKYSAERDGKKLGEALCDVREAESPEDREEALEDVDEQLDDLAGKYAMFTAEDRADIDNNLADYAEHSVQGNDELLQQDVAVLQRSAQSIREDVDEVSQAAWDGLLQGLADCTTGDD
ncbi:MAG TPA: hypothetical protein VJM33_06140 [Microthrixaceae bacterium]|nr:hypothetical protein [Microthrixaceae bacterium]